MHSLIVIACELAFRAVVGSAVTSWYDHKKRYPISPDPFAYVSQAIDQGVQQCAAADRAGYHGDCRNDAIHRCERRRTVRPRQRPRYLSALPPHSEPVGSTRCSTNARRCVVEVAAPAIWPLGRPSRTACRAGFPDFRARRRRGRRNLGASLFAQSDGPTGSSAERLSSRSGALAHFRRPASLWTG
jgi:hypothetical protein